MLKRREKMMSKLFSKKARNYLTRKTKKLSLHRF